MELAWEADEESVKIMLEKKLFDLQQVSDNGTSFFCHKLKVHRDSDILNKEIKKLVDVMDKPIDIYEKQMENESILTDMIRKP